MPQTLRWLVGLAFVCSLIVTCKTARNDRASRRPELASPKEEAAEVAGGLELISSSEVVPRSMVHEIRLDEAEFKVPMVRVGEQFYIRYNTPVVIFQMPKDADYVEIMRCPSNLIISGGSDLLEDVEMFAASTEDETRIYQRNNFWDAAARSAGCVLVAGSYTDVSFADTFAPTGKFYYFVRACVDPQRLVAREKFLSVNCSRQVSRSVEHEHENLRSQQEMEEFQRASVLRGKIDTIRRTVVRKTQLLTQALYSCQERNNRRIMNGEQKKGINHLISLGAGLGGGAAAGAAGGYILNRGNTRTGKVTSTIAGALFGGAMGFMIAELAQGIDQARSFKPAGFPKDDAKCYKGGEDSLVTTLEQQATMVCSCADVETLQNELGFLKKDLEQLGGLHDTIYKKNDTGAAPAAAPGTESAAPPAAPGGT